MKKQILILSTLAIFTSTYAQDLAQNEVPSVILNQFNKSFPVASDIDWEMEGTLYNVEFETDYNVDNEIWFNKKGEIVKYKSDFAIDKLPKKVKETLKKNFSEYNIDDLEQISEPGKIVYKMELNSFLKQDWDIIIDKNGTILNQIAD